MPTWNEVLQRTNATAQRLGLDTRDVMWNGDRLRSARRAAKISQSELAATLGVTQPTIQRYEAGTRIPGETTLERLAMALGIPRGALFS